MVVWLASFPRSGNTFYRIALEKLYGLESLSVYEDDPASISRRASTRFENGLDQFRSSADLHFIKTHEMPGDDSPAILLVRDGRDAMVSFAHFIEDYGIVKRSGVEALLARLDACKQQWIHGRPPFDQLLRKVIDREFFDWSGHYQAWRHRRAGCAVVKFEELVQDPEGCVTASLDRLGIHPAGAWQRQEHVPTFETLHARDPKFYRAGRTGQWRTEMSPETEEMFWRHHENAMLDAGYAR